MTFKTFRFDIDPKWENFIREKRKTIDVRMNIKPFADVDKDDFIEYSTTKVKVKKIRGYPGISDLIAYEDYKKIIPDAQSREEALEKLHELYAHADSTHGILAFEIEPVE